MTPDKWVLVTGAPRSGTTFVGSVLAFPREIDYIHEPFNPECGMNGFRIRYPYSSGEGQGGAELESWISRLLAYRFELKTVMYPGDTLFRRWVKRIVGSRGVNYLRLARINPFHQYALVKDPFACILADHLSRVHNFKVLALIRHPVAFVAAIRRMQWEPTKGLKAIAENPDLVADHFRGEECLLKPAETIVENAARLWRALNKVILRQAGANPRIKIVTLEKISAAPLEQFRDLYTWAGLPWREPYGRKILRMTSGHNRTEAKSLAQDFKRNSADLLSYRLGQMSRQDTETIWEITRDIASTLYHEPT